MSGDLHIGGVHGLLGSGFGLFACVVGRRCGGCGLMCARWLAHLAHWSGNLPIGAMAGAIGAVVGSIGTAQRRGVQQVAIGVDCRGLS